MRVMSLPFKILRKQIFDSSNFSKLKHFSPLKTYSLQKITTFPLPVINYYFTRPLSFDRYLDLEKKLRERRREVLLYCQHPLCLTAGLKEKNKERKFLSLERENDYSEGRINNEDRAREKKRGKATDGKEKYKVPIYYIKRGGYIVVHELGQCVIYLHVDLKKRGLKINKFFYDLLAITQKNIEGVWGISTEINDENPGLYLRKDEKTKKNQEKLAFIGLCFNSFFTSNGIAININNSMKTFSHIDTCGVENQKITSIQNEGGNIDYLSTFLDAWQSDFFALLNERS